MSAVKYNERGSTSKAINVVYPRAIERGFSLEERPLKIDDFYILDAPRSGRLKK